MKNLSNRKIVSNLLGISEKSYYRWKETRKIFQLLEKYFSDEDLIEFLETGKIKRLEKEFDINDIIQKLYKFKKNSLLYFYFLLDNEKEIKDTHDFKAAINKDISNSQNEPSVNKFIKFLKSINYSYSINKISLNSYAQEFKNEYADYISDDETDFILKDYRNRGILKLNIDIVISN